MIEMLHKAGLLLSLVLLAPLSHAQQDEIGSEQRCKAGNIAATAPSSRYQKNTDGTVVDTETGLMWRSCLQGVAGEACDEGEPLELNWADVLRYVSHLNARDGFAGHTDWRLPNIRELSTLVELQCSDPAINLAVFPNAAPSHVWSSSPSYFHTHYSWYVNFQTGAFTYGEREKAKAIRLVRGGESR